MTFALPVTTDSKRLARDLREKTAPDRSHLISTFVALILLLGGALSGCRPHSGRGPHATADPAPRTADADGSSEVGYLPPPQLVSVARSSTALTMMGHAAADARVELMAPEGDTFSTQANHAGAWRLTLPAAARPRMFALAARVRDGAGERILHSEGAVILIPHSGPPALLVRAGAGAEVFAAKTIRPSLDALDYDPGGFSAAAGRARPGASVRLIMDGAFAGVAQADAGGRYSILAANLRLAFGSHGAVVQSADGQDARRFTLDPPGSTLTTLYKVDPMPDGWRLEWAIPGGGVQTTLVFIPVG